MSVFRRHGRAFALAFALVANVAGTAVAAEFSVNPTRVHLDRARAIETVVLGNADTRPLSFEVEVKRWTMAADGGWQLQPSDELVVHPLVFTVQPGEQARLRVGTLSADVDAERAYRIELQQLPGEDADAGIQVELLTRVSVPVFVQPQAAEVQAALADPALTDGSLRAMLANTGARYLPPQQGRLRLLDKGGQPLHETSVQVGYVLAGARLPLTVDAVPAAACARAARIELQLPELPGALPEAARTVAAPLPAGARRCGG
jgi:fimbrial chaperone protein